MPIAVRRMTVVSEQFACFAVRLSSRSSSREIRSVAASGAAFLR